MSGPTSSPIRHATDEVSAHGSYLHGRHNGFRTTHRHGAYTKPAIRKEVEVGDLLMEILINFFVSDEERGAAQWLYEQLDELAQLSDNVVGWDRLDH